MGTKSQSKNEMELSFIEKEIYYKIKYKDILYFASHGKSSIIHTINGDYNISDRHLADAIAELSEQKVLIS